MMNKLGAKGRVQVLNLVEVPGKYYNRVLTGNKALDEIFGGEEMPGILPGSSILFTGFPGSGKTTLILQVADLIQRKMGVSVLYNTGEQAKAMIKLYHDRLRLNGDFCVSKFEYVEDLIEYCENTGVDILIQDSLQSLKHRDYEDNKLVKVVGRRLSRWAEESGTTLVLVGQITKSGDYAGHAGLAHDVDTRMHLTINKDTGNRVLELLKNRHGPAMLPHEFFMSANGMELREVPAGERENVTKTQRSYEKKTEMIAKAKELMLAGERLNGYSSTDHGVLSKWIDERFGVNSCSGGYWRGILAKAVRELENEGHRLGRATVDRRENFFVEV